MDPEPVVIVFSYADASFVNRPGRSDGPFFPWRLSPWHLEQLSWKSFAVSMAAGSGSLSTEVDASVSLTTGGAGASVGVVGSSAPAQAARMKITPNVITHIVFLMVICLSSGPPIPCF
jgi:hypothetical protein